MIVKFNRNALFRNTKDDNYVSFIVTRCKFPHLCKLLLLFVFTTNVNATINFTGDETTGNYTVNWTSGWLNYGSGCSGQSKYKLHEVHNGTTLYYYTDQKYFTFYKKPEGYYYYDVAYLVCYISYSYYQTASGSISTTVLPPAPPSGARKVEYIHTDLLGSPSATSDEQGNVDE